jgi:hypothetical protein
MKKQNELVNQKNTIQNAEPKIIPEVQASKTIPKENTVSLADPIKAVSSKQSVTVNTATKSSIKLKNTEPSLVVQTKPIDARWSVDGLTKNVTAIMGRDPGDGNVYAFINKWMTIMLIMQYTQKGPSVLKRKFKEKADWPTLIPNAKDTTLTLKGVEKNKFLENKGCPKDLS